MLSCCRCRLMRSGRVHLLMGLCCREPQRQSLGDPYSLASREHTRHYCQAISRRRTAVLIRQSASWCQRPMCYHSFCWVLTLKKAARASHKLRTLQRLTGLISNQYRVRRLCSTSRYLPPPTLHHTRGRLQNQTWMPCWLRLRHYRQSRRHRKSHRRHDRRRCCRLKACNPVLLHLHQKRTHRRLACHHDQHLTTTLVEGRLCDLPLLTKSQSLPTRVGRRLRRCLVVRMTLSLIQTNLRPGLPLAQRLAIHARRQPASTTHARRIRSQSQVAVQRKSGNQSQSQSQMMRHRESAVPR